MNQFNIVWVIYDPHGDMVPFTNAPSKRASVQFLLHRMSPGQFPPVTNDLHLVGMNAENAWRDLQEKGFKARRLDVHILLDEVDEAETL